MTLRRIHEYLDRIEEAVVDEVRPARRGVALLTPSLPLVWQLNALRVEDTTAGPADLVEEADRMLGDLGTRKLVPRRGARSPSDPAAHHHGVERLPALVMVRDRPPERRVAEKSGGEIDRRAAPRAWPRFGASSRLAGKRKPSTSWRPWTSVSIARRPRATSAHP